MFASKLATLFHCRNANVYRTISCKCLSICSYNTKKCVEGLKPLICAVRYYHDYEVNPSVQNSYRNLDKISKDYEIIYRAPLTSYIRAAHYVTFFTGTSVPLITLVYLAFNGPFIFPIEFGNLPLIRNYFDFTAFYGGLFLMISQLYMIVQRYPLRVYSDTKGNYIAIYRSIVPWMVTKETFKAGELQKASSFLPWGDSLYQFKSRKAILLEDHFFRPVDLANMLGQKAEEKNESETERDNDKEEKRHQ